MYLFIFQEEEERLQKEEEERREHEEYLRLKEQFSVEDKGEEALTTEEVCTNMCSCDRTNGSGQSK